LAYAFTHVDLRVVHVESHAGERSLGNLITKACLKHVLKRYAG
jgi:hypothetical protein